MSACFLIDLSLYRSMWWITQCGCNTTQPPIAVGSVSLKEFVLFSFVLLFLHLFVAAYRMAVCRCRALGCSDKALALSHFLFLVIHWFSFKRQKRRKEKNDGKCPSCEQFRTLLYSFVCVIWFVLL